jgi:hypothetical protein
VWEGQKIHKSLVKRAVGFRYTETTSETDDSGVLKITKKVSKYYPPDVAAIKHWQSNMDPENWKDRQSFEIENKEPIPLDDFYKDADSKPEPS